MKNVHKLTEGAVLLAVFAVLLLMTIYLPVLGAVTNLFIALPFILFAAKNDRKSSLVFLVGALLISLIVGTVLSIPLALTYGLTGIVIGDFIRERKRRIAGYIAGSLTFLVALVSQYAISVAFFEMDIIKESIEMLDESVEQSFTLLERFGQSPDPLVIEQVTAGLDMVEVLIPSIFVMASFIIVFIVELVTLPIVRRFGVDVPKWGPFRNLDLPKSLLWYYLFVLLAALIFNPELGTYWHTAMINLSFVLQFFMVLQGLSFIYYLSFQKGYPAFIPVTVTVLAVLLPIVLYIIRILGIIDLGFNLRKQISGQTK